MSKTEKPLLTRVTRETARLPLGLLHLPSRAQSALARSGYATIGQIIRLSARRLSTIPKLGPTHRPYVEAAQKALRASVSDSGAVNWRRYWHLQSITLIPEGFSNKASPDEVIHAMLDIIRVILEKNSDARFWFIVQRRFELKGAQHVALGDLGEALDVTRERIRQLEEAALQDLRGMLIEGDYGGKEYHVHPVILETVDRLVSVALTLRDQPLLERTLMERIHTQTGVETDSAWPSLSLLLNIIGLTRVAFNRQGLEPVWGIFDANEMRSVRNSVELLDRIFSKQALPLGEDDILVHHNKRVRKKSRLSLEDLRSLLKLCSTVEEYKKGVYWRGFEFLKGHANQAERILFEYGEPMHFSDIARTITQRTAPHGKQGVTGRTIARRLSGDERFTPIGRSGEWSLSQWSVETGTIVEIMEQCLIACNGPLTVEEIYAYVRERRPVQRRTIESYLSSEQ